MAFQYPVQANGYLGDNNNDTEHYYNDFDDKYRCTEYHHGGGEYNRKPGFKEDT